MVLRWGPCGDDSSGHLLSLPPMSWIPHMPVAWWALLGTGYRRLDQPPALPELLGPCSHFRVRWVCRRLPEGAAGALGLSEQVQGVGKEQVWTLLTSSLCCPSGWALAVPPLSPISYQRRV